MDNIDIEKLDNRIKELQRIVAVKKASLESLKRERENEQKKEDYFRNAFEKMAHLRRLYDEAANVMKEEECELSQLEAQKLKTAKAKEKLEQQVADQKAFLECHEILDASKSTQEVCST